MKPKQTPRPPRQPQPAGHAPKSAQGHSERLRGGSNKGDQGMRERPKPPINVMLYGQHPVVEALRILSAARRPFGSIKANRKN